jgi:CrcB protein
MALAGGLGAGTRFVLDGVIRARVASQFPWATMLINVTGSLLLGVLAGLVLFHGSAATARLVIGTGFCGGYTTFSTASFESVRLLQHRKYGQALANAVGTLLLTAAAAAAGMAIASL